MFYWFLFICLFFLLTFNSTLSHRPKYRNEIFYVQPTNHPTTIFKRKIYINRYAPTTTTQNQPFEHTHPTWSICYCYLTIQSKWIYNTKIRKKKKWNVTYQIIVQFEMHNPHKRRQTLLKYWVWTIYLLSSQIWTKIEIILKKKKNK